MFYVHLGHLQSDIEQLSSVLCSISRLETKVRRLKQSAETSDLKRIEKVEHCIRSLSRGSTQLKQVMMSLQDDVEYTKKLNAQEVEKLERLLAKLFAD